MKFEQKHIIIAVIILVIIIAIYFFIRGKRSATGPKVKYPEGGSTIPKGWNPEPIATQLYDAMNGLFTDPWTKEKAFLAAFNVSNDEMLIAIYDVFNQKYYKEGGTLTQWVKDEKLTVPGGAKGYLLDRLNKLGLV